MRAFSPTEGLDLEFVSTSQEGTPKNGSEDTRLVNPIVCHAPFEDGQVKLFRACEEGNVRRAYDLSKKTVEGRDVRITSLQPSRPLHAIVVAPNSPIDRPAQLAGVPVGVNFFAGSHFAAIRLLEGFIGRERSNCSISVARRRDLTRCWPAKCRPRSSWSPMCRSPRSSAPISWRKAISSPPISPATTFRRKTSRRFTVRSIAPPISSMPRRPTSANTSAI